MPEQSKSQTPLASSGATEARAKLADLIGRVAYTKERIRFTPGGQDVGVLVPMEDYERSGLRLEQISGGGEEASSPPRC